MLVKRIFLVLHESDANRQDIHILLDLVAQSLDMIQTCGILLCGDDEFGSGQCSKRVVDDLNVLLCKLMMVGKGERCEV